MKTSNRWSIVAFLGICLCAAGVQAQGARDAEVLVPLARGVVAAPAGNDQVIEGAIIEELPAVVAPRWSAEDEGVTAESTMPKSYWLGLFALCAGMAGALTLRRLARRPSVRHSLPPAAGEGRISLV